MVEEVLTGRSGSRLLHPREFIESLKDVDAMVCALFVPREAMFRESQDAISPGTSELGDAVSIFRISRQSEVCWAVRCLVAREREKAYSVCRVEAVRLALLLAGAEGTSSCSSCESWLWSTSCWPTGWNEVRMIDLEFKTVMPDDSRLAEGLRQYLGRDVGL